MSAQEQTLRQYHELMQLNAVSHLFRAAREVGILNELQSGQRTLDQLCESLGLAKEPTRLLLDALVAVGLIEAYGEDFANAAATSLLCQYDADLGDRRWDRLAARVRRGSQPVEDHAEHFDSVAATQWSHTAAAMQAAEILDIGGEGEAVGLSLLDFGCGSAVWSCAMAHRDAEATVTAVDRPARLAAAKSMAESIGLETRFQWIESLPETAELPSDSFDLVLIAQRLHALSDETGDELLRKATAALKPGGRLVVIDQFRSPTSGSSAEKTNLPPRAGLTEAVEALKFDLETPSGRLRTLEETQSRLAGAGLQKVQFSFIAASRLNLGIAVGSNPQ